MTVTNEQIQALRAAIDDATQGSWVNESGEGWEAICCDDDQGNAGFIIAEFQGRDAAANRKFVQAANPAVILSLLADRDADKALIAEQEKRIAEMEQRHCGGALMEREEHHVGVVNKLLERIAELEARTLTVKLPTKHNNPGFVTDGIWNKAIDECYLAFIEACTAAGITLDVGE